VDTRDPLPLILRFPALAAIPRVPLGEFPTPVQRAGPGFPPNLWIKRDDLTAPILGGNKIRALEFLLAGVAPGSVVLTGGGEGSTHILTTATYARQLGAITRVIRWKHDMNPSAIAVAERARLLCDRITTTRSSVVGVLRAHAARRPSIRWIPLGGTSPLGMLGHVNAALELAAQISRGELPVPEYIVLPVGSGGTAAGLALGLSIAGLRTHVVGARVAPLMVAGRSRVLRLAESARAFLERAAGERIARIEGARVEIVHDAYAGAYGRPLPQAAASAEMLARTTGICVDGTYSAKALHVAVARAAASESSTLFWLTYDGRAVNSRPVHRA
jgi:D-cysteine desulfhydrase